MFSSTADSGRRGRRTGWRRSPDASALLRTRSGTQPSCVKHRIERGQVGVAHAELAELGTLAERGGAVGRRVSARSESPRRRASCRSTPLHQSGESAAPASSDAPARGVAIIAKPAATSRGRCDAASTRARRRHRASQRRGRLARRSRTSAGGEPPVGDGSTRTPAIDGAAPNRARGAEAVVGRHAAAAASPSPRAARREEKAKCGLGLADAVAAELAAARSSSAAPARSRAAAGRHAD